MIRLQAVMDMLNGYVVENGDGNLTRYAFLMHSLTDEVIEELTDKDEDTIGAFMQYMGEVIAWIGHGDNERLPDPLREFADELQPASALSLEPIQA